MRVWLHDGRTLTVPIHWFPRLCDGTPNERNNWEPIESGTSIHWPDLGVELTVAGLLADGPPDGGADYACVDNLEVSDSDICVWLQDGRTLTVPIHWFPRLCDGTPNERNNWEPSGSRSLIRWPDLDEDISVDGLLSGGWSAEGVRTLGRWLLARREGRSVMHYDIVAHQRSVPKALPLA